MRRRLAHAEAMLESGKGCVLGAEMKIPKEVLEEVRTSIDGVETQLRLIETDVFIDESCWERIVNIRRLIRRIGDITEVAHGKRRSKRRV